MVTCNKISKLNVISGNLPVKPILLTVMLTHKKNSKITAIRRSTTITEDDESESEHIHSSSHSWQSQNMDMYTDGSSSTSSDTVRHYCWLIRQIFKCHLILFQDVLWYMLHAGFFHLFILRIIKFFQMRTYNSSRVRGGPMSWRVSICL